MQIITFYTLLILFFISTASGPSACTNSNSDASANVWIANSDTTMSSEINITVNSETFTATLLDNDAARAFKKLLPMTIDMIELNGNEKYYDLPNPLPANASNPERIQQGDLMLYGSRTLVLFYETFSTSYRYTKLGQVDDPAGLKESLSSGNVTVTFELL